MKELRRGPQTPRAGQPANTTHRVSRARAITGGCERNGISSPARRIVEQRLNRKLVPEAGVEPALSLS